VFHFEDDGLLQNVIQYRDFGVTVSLRIGSVATAAAAATR